MVDFHRNVNPGTDGGSHIPPHPFWMAILRVIQGIFSILVLGLSANAASFFYLNGYGMAIFTFIWTLLFLLYIFITPRSFQHFYHFWGHIAFEALTTLFWLVTFALLADYVRAWSALNYFGFNWRNGMSDSTSGAMAFALLNWLLFCVTLIFSLLLSRKHHNGGDTVDGTNGHHHTDGAAAQTGSSGGFKLGSLGAIFSKNKRGQTSDVEKEGGGPVELNDRAGGTAAGYDGQHQQHQQQQQQQQQYPSYPPPAAADGYQAGR